MRSAGVMRVQDVRAGIDVEGARFDGDEAGPGWRRGSSAKEGGELSAADERDAPKPKAYYPFTKHRSSVGSRHNARCAW